jgi:hypothetical protein
MQRRIYRRKAIETADRPRQHSPTMQYFELTRAEARALAAMLLLAATALVAAMATL